MSETNYELIYLLSPDLTGTKLEETAKNIEEALKKVGEILELAKLKKIKLAYPLKKKQEAFLGIFEFKAEPGNIVSFKKELDENKALLRYLLLKKPEIKKEKEETRKKKLPASAKISLKARLKVKPERIEEKEEHKEKKEVEMKEIEEKLKDLV